MNVLYIVMRNDMDSMNPGKAMAQASHATSKFHQKMEQLFKNSAADRAAMLPVIWAAGATADESQYAEWRAQANGFGTVLVVAADMATMNEVYENHKEFFHCGFVTDPTYPVRDGSVTHLIPIETCMWIFGKRSDLIHTIGKMPLHS